MDSNTFRTLIIFAFGSSSGLSARPRRSNRHSSVAAAASFEEEAQKMNVLLPSINLLRESLFNIVFKAVVYANSAFSEIGAFLHFDLPYESYPELI